MDAKQYIDRYSYFPLHKVQIKTEKQFKFFKKGVVGYQQYDSTLVVAGDPICARKTDIPKVLDEFYLWARSNDLVVCGYYFSDYVASKTKELSSYYAGVSVGNDLSNFSIKGKDSKEFRRALNYGEKRKLRFSELSREDYFENFFAIKSLESKWFKNKPKFKRIQFLLSSVKIDNNKVSDRHFVVFDKSNKIVAYISLDNYKESNKKLSFYVDHMFQHPTKYKLALDFLIVKTLMLLQEEGHKYLDFGFCPFRNVKPKSFVEASLYVSQFINYFYNSKGIYNYKKKFCNQKKPVYLMMSPDKSKVKQLYSLFNVTFS